MHVTEIAPGLWRWTGLHPEWTETDRGTEGWEQEVGSVYYETSDAVVLIDPLVPPEDSARFWAALDRDVERAERPVAVLLTVAWHARSCEAILARYGGTREPPEGVDEFRITGTGGEPERLYWLPQHRTLVAGDALLGSDDGGIRLCPESWLPGVGRAGLAEALRPLLDLPTERVLVAHGEPVLADAHAALARALAHAQSSAATAT